MGIQNADDALRIVANALDDRPDVGEFLRRQQRQVADDAFLNSYFGKYPQYKVEVPKASINNADDYAATVEKDRQVKERILKGARQKAVEDAAAIAEKRFYELGYTDDLPNAQELIDNLHQEEILNTPFPYFSDKWNPVNPQPQTAPIPTNNGAIAPEAASVLLTQPQYEGKSTVENAPPSGVNLLADGYQSGTSSGIPLTGSNVPPNKPPGGGNYNFESGNFDSGNNNYGRTFNQYPQGESPEQIPIPGINDFVEAQAFKQAQDAANSGNYFQNLWDGTKKGFTYSTESSHHPGRSAGIFSRAPQDEYAHLQPEGQTGFAVGRVAGDVIGNGTKQVLWRAHPLDIAGTQATKLIQDAGGNRTAEILAAFAAAQGLELGSGIYNPINLAQGGRASGYAAIDPSDDDPRQSTSPVTELIIDRGFFGRKGRLLPWEQFREERPDIPYEQYAKYQDYLRNKDENPLRDATGGFIKGTMDGINGPEVSIMGYSMTPMGIATAALGALAVREGVGRIAGLRKVV
jgi:hypothetical protein